MTALKEYERLESIGLWRAEEGAQRREVVVSFGDATLVIADGAGRPLTHWSLAATARLNPGEHPALFAPDTGADETLEIEDADMIGAIGKVQKSLARRQPRPGRLRHGVSAALVLALLAGGVFWLPGALDRRALDVVPEAQRREIGATVLGHLQRLGGPVCRGQRGRTALARLTDRLFGPGSGAQLMVLPLGRPVALALPGGLIAVDRGLVEGLDDPAALAGHVLMADARRRAADPLADMLNTGGFAATAKLLTTSELPPDLVEDYALSLSDTSTVPRPLPDTTVIATFAAADVPAEPYLASLGDGREASSGDGGNPVMSDADWVALQSICTL